MALWLLFAALAAGVAAALALLPIRSASSSQADDPTPDLAVYRDQLAEIEADRARGAIAGTEAEAARAEIARRVLREADRAAALPVAPSAAVPSAARGARTRFLAAALIPLASLALYLHLGSPALPGRPLSARLAASPENAIGADLIAKVEAHLREAPGDGQGWDVIAPVYARQGRWTDAADAYLNALRLLGENPKRLSGLGEALVMASDGLVGDDARKVFVKLAALDPERIEPRFWLAVAKEQDGEHVYHLDKDLKTVHRVVSDLKQPNGITGTPDGKTLYVADIGAGKTYRYRIAPDHSLSDKTLFCELGSDGMTLDSEGNVYLTGKGVTVFDRTGKQVEHIDVAEPWTANVRIGGVHHDMLFVTASKSVYGIRLRTHAAK